MSKTMRDKFGLVPVCEFCHERVSTETWEQHALECKAIEVVVTDRQILATTDVEQPEPDLGRAIFTGVVVGAVLSAPLWALAIGTEFAGFWPAVRFSSPLWVFAAAVVFWFLVKPTRRGE